MSLILERSSEEGGAIYLGNLEAASNVEYLKAHGIGAVLTVAGQTGLRYNPRDIPLHDVIQADDALYQDLSQYFNRMIEFIERARHSTNILVHCYAGISRSVTAVLVYLMQKKQWTYERALAFVRAQRHIANPNPSFVKQIKQYEHSLFQNQIVHHSFSHNNNSNQSKVNNPFIYHSAQPKVSGTKRPIFTPTPNGARPLIDQLFDTPVKRPSSAYPSRQQYYGNQLDQPATMQPAQRALIQNPYEQQTKPQASWLSPQKVASKQYPKQIYSSPQPVSRVLFSGNNNGYPQTAQTGANNNNINNNPYSYAKYSYQPTQPFSQASKNGMYVNKIPNRSQGEIYQSQPYPGYRQPLY